jgi:hypothetical protein
MPSVQPITVSDLNGIEFSPKEMFIDDVVGYVGYVKNLCTHLGTERDSEEGYKDFQDFREEISNSHISTFEPDAIDTDHTFEAIDLTGINYQVREYPFYTYFANLGTGMFFSYDKPVTPFDLPETGTVIPTKFVTPFDLHDNEIVDKSNNDDKMIIV